MQFNSYIFILLFLPLFITTYHLSNKINKSLGKIVIIISSILFYSYERSEMLIYIGISALINYCFALLIRKTGRRFKYIIISPIIFNIVILLYFKYYNFALSNINLLSGTSLPLKEIILPLGISFYTFQQIAYIVHITNESVENVSLTDYLCYILFFPKLLMGPLMDPNEFIRQINDDSLKHMSINNIACGIKTFSLGLIKKVLIADTFSKAVSWVYSNIDIATSADCLLLILFYTFEIYFDFSGYSDMATGVAEMINIELPINFDSPYKALSIRDFWKRWHISLTKFLTKYIYIPLGGSQKGIFLTYINTLVVFLISGLWHGANWTFILWGLVHGLLCCFDRIFEHIEAKVFTPIRWIATFVAVSILWLLFSAPSITSWLSIISKAFSFQDMSISNDLIGLFDLPETVMIANFPGLNYLFSNMHGFTMTVFVILSFVICLVPDNNYNKRAVLNIPSLILSTVSFVWGILCLGSESVFVYFGF